ncbi:hypothetical protein SSX86_014723 [Deinandra increscens subsp. villosa]|uniref:PHD finger protein 10 n=1 Tax=Deinandra increscens subsp. villosa TaxID=3103831 RepID=A0AAP0H2C2_9ASTR
MVDNTEITVDMTKKSGSAEEIRICYTRKRRKMSSSDEMTKKSGFNDKLEIKAADGDAFSKYLHRLNFDAFSNGPGECSLRKCSNIVLPQMHQTLNGHGGCLQDALVTYPETSCKLFLLQRSVDNVEISDNQTHNSAQQPSHVFSSGLLQQSERSTDSELCWCALSATLNSDKFSELRSLFLKNFGVVSVNRVLNVDAISSKLNKGAYETSPMLYLKDIQQVWTKLQQVGNEMVKLANSLSDNSRAHYEQVHHNKHTYLNTNHSPFLTFRQQFVREPRTTEARGCRGCGEKVDAENYLVCDSCEDIYHFSCTELVDTPIPPESWYCARCDSNGIGSPDSPHDSCVVCEKLKSAASVPLLNSVPTNNQSQDIPNELEEHLHNDGIEESESSKICFICKSDVEMDGNFRICGHSLCAHKFYHYRCLTNEQLTVRAPYWYCPSCLCRHCLVDKDDDKIVLCDGCDQAYHIYCASPELNSIPEGNWFCGKCEGELKTSKRVDENMKKKVKVEDEAEKDEELEGLDMLVTAAKTLSHEDIGCDN